MSVRVYLEGHGLQAKEAKRLDGLHLLWLLSFRCFWIVRLCRMGPLLEVTTVSRPRVSTSSQQGSKIELSP